MWEWLELGRHVQPGQYRRAAIALWDFLLELCKPGLRGASQKELEEACSTLYYSIYPAERPPPGVDTAQAAGV